MAGAVATGNRFGGVTVSLVAHNEVSITGMDVIAAPPSVWELQIRKLAAGLQAEIADQFSQEKVAGQRLSPNSPEYNRRKRRQGYDPRRGHRTNALQRALGGGAGHLYFVSRVTEAGTARIKFIEQRLRNAVPYAEYYAELKSRKTGGRLLVLNIEMVKRASAPLIEFARKREAGARMVRTVLTGAALRAHLRMLADKAERDIAAKLEFARRAPFAESVRPRHIKTTSGLTQGLMMKISKQAQKALKEANQLEAMENRIKAASRRFGN